ncbi:TonB-dependent receptor [Pedobacter sp. BS3]|nr:TonB-dependent receptor [Pedobacter sp. BS3]
MLLKKSIYTILLLITFNVVVAQQTASIKGKVTTSDGQPAVDVSVILKGSGRGTITNTNGEYELNRIKKGTYTIVASAVGLKPAQQTITVDNRNSYTVNFTLAVNSEQLREVVISAKNLNRENKVVAKMPLKNLENPQVYSTVSSEILKQQGITTYDDAMRNIPGIVRTWESTGRTGDGAAYFALRGFDAQPALYNGLPGLVSGNLDPANVEEIQVIKGPSGTLFGGSFYSYGGLINTITKKPYFTTGGEIAYNFGSFGLNRITADINTPLSKTEKIALRINTAFHQENSFQDAGFKKSFFIAPSLVYEVNDRLSFHFNTEILQEERAVAPVFFHSDRVNPLPYKNLKELNLDNNLSFTSNDLTIKNPRYNMQGQIIYKLSDQWTSQTVFSRSSAKSDGIYGYIWDDNSTDGYFEQYLGNEQSTINATNIQQNFNGDFKIGNLRNRVLLGLDYYSTNVINNSSGSELARHVTPQQAEGYYIDKSTGDTLAAPVYLTRFYVDSLLANAGGINSNVTNGYYGAYISDVFNVTPKLSAMASIRADYYKSRGTDNDYSQWAFSPKFGLVYQPVLDKVSLFASYMNAFVNVSPATVYDNNDNPIGVRSFKPEHANQWEYGVKTNLFSDKLFATVSVYDIKVSDRVTPDPANPNNSVQGGKVSSKGFELDINANPFTGLNLLAGYSYNKTKTLAGNTTDFYSEPGRSPGGQGPQNLANLWATYTITSGGLKNFGIGLGGNYASDYKVIDNSQTGVFILPSYTLLNGSVFYNSDKFRITVNVNNLTDEVYYSGYWSVNPQRPRNYVVGFAYKF